MARTGRSRFIGAICAAGLAAGPLVAQQLDPRVAMPLMQMIEAAGAQCQAGNMQACAMAQQLQQAGNELMQAQFACQQGNPQACQVFQMGAQQVMAAWQQNFGGMQGGMPQAQPYTPPYTPPYTQQQQAWDHQQRMQQQQMQFQQHQQQMQQQQRMFDQQNQRFLEQMRR